MFSGNPQTSDHPLGTRVGYGMNYLAGAPTGRYGDFDSPYKPKLTGIADMIARTNRYPEMQRRLDAMGETNASKNPFSSQYAFFGDPTTVFSPEVPNP